jgi:ABC-type amino acid transport substrate-binding protein
MVSTGQRRLRAVVGGLSLAAICLAGGHSTAALAATSPVLDHIKRTGAIRLGYRENLIPFAYVLDGKPVGYAVDLCLRAADAVRTALKLPSMAVEWVPVTSANRLSMIATGKADLECGSTTNNATRREQVAFTIPHYIAGSRMLVKTVSNIHKWADMTGKTVVSTAGTTPLEIVRTLTEGNTMGVKVLVAKDHAEAFSLVESGKADAFVMDDVLLYGLRANAKVPADYTVTGDMLTIEPYAIMLPKDDIEFKKIVDKALVASIYDQETLKLYKKWFQQPIAPNGVNMDIPMNYLLRDSFKFPSDKVGD